MKKISFAIVFLQYIITSAFSQSKIDSTTLRAINTNYGLALQFKDGKDVAINYDSAFHYFNNAAVLGDPQSIYAVAYMYYKGLGCRQNYDTAAILFEKGAQYGRDNSLYFYGLCWRNGYGKPRNEDSAQYYLKKSADLGYRQAVLELASKTAENSNDSAAQALLQRLHNAAIPDKNVLNHFNRIQPKLPSEDVIAGEYKGWMIQYDLSGAHIISVNSLTLHLEYNHKNITGQWIEGEIDTAKISATIQADSIVFKKSSYGRKDHYSTDKPIKYDFQNAKLNLVQAGDSIFLAGNVEMFSPVRGEPSKPIFIALSRKGLNQLDSLFLTKLGLTAYPNPFSNLITVQFNLIHSSTVDVQLWDMDGKMIYKKEAGTLASGEYAFPLSQIKIASGVYILKLYFGNQYKAIKLVKQ